MAGIIIAATGETAVFFVDAVSFLGVVVVLTWLSRLLTPAAASAAPAPVTAPSPPPAAAPSAAPAPAAAPSLAPAPAAPAAVQTIPAARRFRWLLDLPSGVRAAAAMALLVGGFGLQFAVINPLMADRVFRLGPVGFGLFGTFLAIGGIGGSYYSARRPDPGHREFVAWALTFGLVECLAAIAPAAWAYDAAMVALGAATQLFAVSATVYVQQATPPAQRGHALSAYNAGFIGFVPAGAFLIAAIASAAGTRWALAGPGLAIAACATTLLLTAVPSSDQTAAITEAADRSGK